MHIGTGEDYEPTQYVIDGERLFSFSPEAALRALPETARADLLKILDGPPTRATASNRCRRSFHRHRRTPDPRSRARHPGAAQHRRRICRAGRQDRAAGASGREIINQLRIARTYGDPATRRPILPGSSLKGAIRTALLDRVNGGASLRRRESERCRRTNATWRSSSACSATAEQFDHDPMRLVQLGDAADQRPADTHRHRDPLRRQSQAPAGHQGWSRGRMRMAQNLRQVIECVPPLRPRAFLGSLTLQDPGALDRPQAARPGLALDLRRPGRRLQRLLSSDPGARTARTADRAAIWTPAWRATVEQILATHQPALDANRAFLLRVGFHSGAESVTLNGVRDIKIIMGKDPRRKTRYEYLPASQDRLARRPRHPGAARPAALWLAPGRGRPGRSALRPLADRSDRRHRRLRQRPNRPGSRMRRPAALSCRRAWTNNVPANRQCAPS